MLKKQNSGCPDINGKQWEALVFIARESGVLARVHHVLADKELLDAVPDFVLKHTNAAKMYADKQAHQVKFESALLSEIIKNDQVRDFAFMKGAAYVLSDSPVAKGRTFSDIDLLVSKSQIEDIERKLVVYGWFQDETSDYDQRYYRQWTHEIPPLRNNARGTILDLHHNILPPVSGRAPNIQLFWDKVITTSSGSQVFSKPALALHSLTHLFFQEEFSHGFRDLSDLNILFSSVEKEDDFWTDILELAIATRFETELFYAYRYCKLIFATDFPPQFVDKIGQYSPGKLRLKMLDWLFLRVLLPQHRFSDIPLLALANTIALIRGHGLKMPLHILLYHSISKLFLSINFLLTGRDGKNPPQNEEQGQ